MDKLKLTCANFFALSNISMYCYSNEGETLFCFPEYYGDLKEDFVKYCTEKMEAIDPKRHTPIIVTIDNKFHLATIPLQHGLTLFAGPVALNPDGLGFLSIYSTYSKRQQCLKMSYEKFINAISLLIQLCTGKQNQVTEFISMETPNLDIEDTSNDTLPNSNIRASYKGAALEQRLMTYIEKGNVEGLKKQFGLSSYVAIDAMSSNPVQHQKYLFIIFMTMAVRAAIKGGLDDEQAFSIVNGFCLRMDKCVDITEISSLMYNMAMSLCHKVYKYGIKSSISSEIRKCCTFIASHLYSPLDLKKLAQVTNMSTRNLSKRFHEEIGKTPMAYVQSARIEEAKFLLRYTQYPLLDISNALHFSSQSHFTNVFRQVTGMTPKKFQEQTIL